MIRTIKQRIYLIGLLPLAVLAVLLVVFNGLYQIDEANRELRNSQEITANLLNSAAAEAAHAGKHTELRATRQRQRSRLHRFSCAFV